MRKFDVIARSAAAEPVCLYAQKGHIVGKVELVPQEFQRGAIRGIPTD